MPTALRLTVLGKKTPSKKGGGIEHMENQTELIIRRGSTYVDRLRAYKVVVDRVAVATVRDGQSVAVPITPGRHSLRMRIDWTGSGEVEFDARPGEKVAFECGSNASERRPFFAFVYVLSRQRYFWLRRTT
jgi:hypothetical protein